MAVVSHQMHNSSPLHMRQGTRGRGLPGMWGGTGLSLPLPMTLAKSLSLSRGQCFPTCEIEERETGVWGIEFFHL